MKQTINVPVTDIRAFKKNSSHIKKNNIMPILDFIKFDNGSITKTNLHEFVVQDSSFKGSFLIEERVLFNFIEYTSSPEITFTADGNKITLSDGSQKTTATQGDISLYPTTEIPPTEKVSLTDTILKYFGAAAKYTQDHATDLIISHIFIGGDVIAASDRYIAYYRKIDRELPKTAIPKSVAERVSSIDPADFSQTENKLYFKTSKTLYGFRKTEATFVDLSRFFEYEKTSSFEAPKSELIGFNDMCLSMSLSKQCYPILELANGKLKLTANDGDFAIDNEKEINVIGQMEGQFKTDAAWFNRLLKTAPDDELTFNRVQGRIYITGESGFTSLIMELL